jgi:hypothetical protein
VEARRRARANLVAPRPEVTGTPWVPRWGWDPSKTRTAVTPDFVKSGSYEIEVSGKRYPARASLRPMYDPKGQKSGS